MHPTKTLLIEQLSEQVEHDAILNILNGVQLNDVTASTVLLSSVLGKVLISLDTGLQKTSVMAALAVTSLVTNKGKKTLMIIPPEAKHNIPKLRDWLSFLNIAVLDSELGPMGRMHSYQEILTLKADVIIISPKLLFSKDFTNLWVMGIKDLVGTTIVDEVHLLANPNTQSGYMLKHIADHSTEFFPLTATPGRDIEQFNFLLSLVNEELPYLSVSRKDLDLEGEFTVFMSKTNIASIPRKLLDMDEPNRLFRYRRLIHPENPLFLDVMQFVENNAHAGVLVYTRFLEAQEVICNTLRSRGIRTAIINSNVSTEERQEVSEKVSRGDLDVVITTITSAIDIPYSCLVCWGWCSDIVQLVGRLNRTYQKKDVTIYLNLLEFELELLEKHLYQLRELAVLTEKSTSLFSAIQQQI